MGATWFKDIDTGGVACVGTSWHGLDETLGAVRRMRFALLAGWGMAVFVARHRQVLHVGDMYGPVRCDKQHICFLGVGRPTNSTAEVSAIVWSLMATESLPHHVRSTTKIRQ